MQLFTSPKHWCDICLCICVGIVVMWMGFLLWRTAGSIMMTHLRYDRTLDRNSAPFMKGYPSLQSLSCLVIFCRSLRRSWCPLWGGKKAMKSSFTSLLFYSVIGDDDYVNRTHTFLKYWWAIMLTDHYLWLTQGIVRSAAVYESSSYSTYYQGKHVNWLTYSLTCILWP